MATTKKSRKLGLLRRAANLDGRTRQARQIREIKAKGYSPGYEARLIRGVMQGKSRQQARGHHVGEAQERRQHEREQNEGLSNAEDASVRNWYNKRFNPRGLKEIPSEEDVIDFARAQGITDFRAYQKTWNAARAQYVKELKAGAWASRGLPYLDWLTEQARVRPSGDREWLYYH